MPITVVPITPQTQVRTTEGDALLFRIPYDQLRSAGKKRFDRIERYNKYKDALYDMCQDIGLILPVNDYHRVLFYMPMPDSWRKWKRQANAWRVHQSRPDWDNLAKAFYDALLPARDQSVCDVRITKIWVDYTDGWIEVVSGLSLLDYGPDVLIPVEDRPWPLGRLARKQMLTAQ